MVSQDEESRKRHCVFRQAVRTDVIGVKRQKKDEAAGICDRLMEDDDALDRLLTELKNSDEATAVRKMAPEYVNDINEGIAFSELCRSINVFQIDKDGFWNDLLGKMQMNGHDSVLKHYNSCGFCESAAVAAMSKHPNTISKLFFDPDSRQGKVPSYIAFSGASGSGKTHTMLWTVHEVIEKEIPQDKKCLKYYISSNAPDEQSLFDYVKDHATQRLNELIRHRQKHYTLEDFKKHCKETWLVLILDEVPGRWKHQSYHDLPSQLENELDFDKVILIVGSTAISQDVCRQPTAGFEVLNIRMKPLSENTMPALLRHHLQRKKPKIKCLDNLVKQLFVEMPLLLDLMANQRCAGLTVDVLAELLGGEIPMQILPDGWCQGHSSTLLSMVACRYRELNGLRLKSPEECQRIMLESLALLAAQPVVREEVGVDKDPKEGSLTVLAKELLETGLVERAILPDDNKDLNDSQKIKVDGHYEFEMSPALTLLCVAVVVPWIEGIYSASDHFEALVAALIVAMRYARTNIHYKVFRLEKAVPYSGNEQHLYFEPSEPLSKNCCINGPQAPYGDLMLAGVPRSLELPDTATPLIKALSEEKGVKNFPVLPMVVQCKHTANEEEVVSCTFTNEFAKMGFVEKDGQITSPAENPFTDNQKKNQKRYEPGRWLTKNWVDAETDRNPDGCNAFVAFATNTLFAADAPSENTNVTLMQGGGDADYAWQKLYPIISLVRSATAGKAGREKKEVPVKCTLIT